MSLAVSTRGYGKNLFVTPIRGDNRYLYYYDIWSNIHYGYIMGVLGESFLATEVYSLAQGGLSALENGTRKYTESLNDLVHLEQGVFSPFVHILKSLSAAIDMVEQLAGELEDWVSVDIGWNLAKSAGIYVQPEVLHRAIFNNRLSWDEGEVRYHWMQLMFRHAG